jgi:hypothetical protein
VININKKNDLNIIQKVNSKNDLKLKGLLIMVATASTKLQLFHLKKNTES